MTREGQVAKAINRQVLTDALSKTSPSAGGKETPENKEGLLVGEYQAGLANHKHLNDRLWFSAPVFITGSLIALGWLATDRPGPIMLVGGLLVFIVVTTYIRILCSWIKLDRVEIHRLFELEAKLGFRRVRYGALLGREDASLNDEDFSAGLANARYWIARTLPHHIPWLRRQRNDEADAAYIDRVKGGGNKALLWMLQLFRLGALLVSGAGLLEIIGVEAWQQFVSEQNTEPVLV